jgi:P4 family phage/plasmid primase-like protien
MIPPHLQNPDFRFILVQAQDKRPMENFWECQTLKDAQNKWESQKLSADKSKREYRKEPPRKISQYTHDNPQLQNHIQDGGNYGIVCGIGGLIVADIDREIPNLEVPNTLTIETPSGGKHYYLICHEIKKKQILEVDKIHYGEIQAGGNTQIIGPGCNAKSKITGNIQPYKIINDAPIAEINYDELRDIFGAYFKKQTEKRNGKQLFIDNRFDLPIDRVISLSGFRQNGSEHQGVHPVHGSKTRNNFTVNTQKNLWHCFRHECGGGVLELIGMVEGIIGCGDKLNKEQYNLVVKLGEEKYGMQRKTPETKTDLKLTVMTYIAQGKDDEATEIMVQDILSRHHIYTVRDDKAPEIWIYNEGIYTPHGKTYIIEECRDILGQAFNKFLMNKVVDKIIADTYIDTLEFFQSKTGDWICVKNGQFNPLTRELKDFNPDDIHFTKLPVDYNPQATCPNIKKHFKEITSNESNVRILEEVGGWFLLNEYKPERAVMLSGHGRNGKGKTIMMWKEFLGIENVATIPLQQFEKDQYAAGDLLNMRANLAGDLDNETLKNTGLFKQVTGRDPISSNRKYLSRIKFNNNAKMVCACNEMPHTRDMSVGFFSRWVLVDFPYRFVKKEDYDSLSYVDREKAKIADPDIINTLITPEELSGYLNLALEGLQRLLKQNDFSTNLTTEQVKREWLKRSDSFGAFIDEFLEEGYGEYISKQELRQVYGRWCGLNKLRIATDRIIKERLSEVLGVFESRRTLNDGDRGMSWEGVRWKESGEGVKGVKGFPNNTARAYSTFTNTLDTLDRVANSNQIINIVQAKGGQEEYFTILEYIEEHPNCSLNDLRELNILGLEDKLWQLKHLGKIYEPYSGKYQAVYD